MDRKEAVGRWTALPRQEELHRCLESLPENVAHSMALGGEPVPVAFEKTSREPAVPTEAVQETGSSVSQKFFVPQFTALTGSEPFPWQRKLFGELTDSSGPRFRSSCPVPTGLGKTSVLAIWLLALAWRVMNGKANGFPRRLAYVVNRRTVVDQATFEAEKLRAALMKKPELADVVSALRQLAANDRADPLAISTLRGEFADNGEWRNDPAQPATIIGTVDMIGSRLLFSGYGRCGFKSKPLHAGLLGQDTLLVHDEAHLEPAFQSLLETIAAEQRRGRDHHTLSDSRSLHVMALSATARTGRAQEAKPDLDEPLFSEEDEAHEEAGKRLRAKKWLDFHPSESDKKLVATVAAQAIALGDSSAAILVFLRGVEDVRVVAKRLDKEKLVVETLTGTQRGWERDKLAKEHDIFARFLPAKDRRVEPRKGTVYLVCTSAGEVGINLSADHLVCDLTPLDSMMQRFGRVNRFGDGEARIEVVFVGKAKEAVAQAAETPTQSEVATTNADAGAGSGEPETAHQDEPAGKKKKEASPYDLACEQTLALLRALPEGPDTKGRTGLSGSPAALSRMLGALSASQRKAAFTPEPVILPATDILFDAWALTTVRGKLPGRPPVADWLHGLNDWEPPETHVAWREEVAIVTGPLLQTHPPEELLEDYPLKPHEQLRDRSERVFKRIKEIAARRPELPVWLVDRDDDVRVTTLAQLAAAEEVLEHATVILPPDAGGLSKTGLLDGRLEWGEDEDHPNYDIADEWRGPKNQPRRRRVWGNAYKPPAMRLVRRIDLPAEADAEDEDEPEIRSWSWYARPRSADDDGSRNARNAQELEVHLRWTGDFAERLVGQLGLEAKPCPGRGAGRAQARLGQESPRLATLHWES